MIERGTQFLVHRFLSIFCCIIEKEDPKERG